MIYVMSDLHGEYQKYLAMLEKIQFNDNDILYIIGDVVDRGDHPIDILKDMMLRSNVYPIMGNHELMAKYVLNKLNVEVTADNIDNHLTLNIMQAYIDWSLNGGQSTLQQFIDLPKEEKLDILDYLEEFEPYEIIDVHDKTFILVHAGFANYESHKKLSDYTLTELTFKRPDYNRQYFEDENVYIVCGHTPSFAIHGKAQIYHSHHNICIDCGATFPQGKLACLCLDTMEEFYID